MNNYRKDKHNIINESLKLSMEKKERWVKKFLRAFPAFKHKNYQLYFGGQLISLSGTWLQLVAQGWLVLQLTHSAFWLGAITALGTLPVLFFALFGGVIVDRFNTKKILFITQSAAMVISLVLGILTVLGQINLLEISILVFLLGIITALDMPARQSYVVEMVGKEDLASAIALNAGIYNGARVIGPGVAGILIGLVGVGGAFILNAVSYIAVLVALWFIKTHAWVTEDHLHPLAAIIEGLRYAFTHPVIKYLLILISFLSIFGWSYTTILPIIAIDTFKVEATGLGYLFAAAGIGALCATLVISAFTKRVEPTVFIIGGNAVFCLSLLLFSFTTSFLLAMIFMFMVGFGLISQTATINSTIQHNVPDELRGRIMSIFALMFVGMSPFGSFQIGYIAEHLGALHAIRIGSLILLLVGIVIYFNRHKLQRISHTTTPVNRQSV